MCVRGSGEWGTFRVTFHAHLTHKFVNTGATAYIHEESHVTLTDLQCAFRPRLA